MSLLMEQYRDDYYSNFGTKYANHVNKFIDYLRRIKKLDAPTTIILEDVKDSVKFYSEIGKINYRASMVSHIDSIKSFYDYLSDSGKAINIFAQPNYEKFKNEVFDYCNLEEGRERETFSTEIIKEILDRLDFDLEKSVDQLTTSRETGRFYQRQILRLFIKLTLIAPAKKSVICNLQFSDFTENYRAVRINKVSIRISNSLRNNILAAIKITSSTNLKAPTPDDKILHYIYQGKFSSSYLNSWFCMFLDEYNILDIDECKNTYELEPLMKSAIKSMVKRMANPAGISKICGIKIATLEKTYYRDNSNFSYSKSIDDDINWEIAKNDYYNYI